MPSLFVFFLLFPLFHARPPVFLRPRDLPNISCPSGSYISFNVCTPCPIAHYSLRPSSPGPDLCLPCPRGTFSSLPALSSPSQCSPCPRGTSSAPGSSSCLSCPVGHHLSTTPKSRKALCNPCQPGTFSKLPNTVNCSPCPDSTVSAAGASKCSPCPPGKEPLFGRCFPCPRNSYNDGTFKECRPCPPGFISTPFSGASRCQPCPLGKAPFDQRCAPCPPGQNTRKPRPACVPDGTGCPRGFFEDKEDVCRTCTTSERYDRMQKRCLGCGPMKVSKGGVAPVCMRCTDGRESWEGRCVCPRGYAGGLMGDCQLCPRGYTWERLESGEGKCRPCGVGFYGTKQRTCKHCEPGTVAPREGMIECEACEDGLRASTLFFEKYPTVMHLVDWERYQRVKEGLEATRSECVRKTNNCPVGTRRVMDSFERFYCEPESCEGKTFETLGVPTGFTSPGTFASFGLQSFDQKVRVCLSCPVGSYLNKGTGRCEKCRNAAVGSISEGGLTTKCKECGKNLFAVFSNDGKRQWCGCVNTAEGPKVRNGVGLMDGQCRRCGKGQVGVWGTEKCTKCGTVGVTGKECRIRCKNGFVGGVGVPCTACPKGQTSFGFAEEGCVPLGG